MTSRESICLFAWCENACSFLQAIRSRSTSAWPRPPRSGAAHWNLKGHGMVSMHFCRLYRFAYHDVNTQHTMCPIIVRSQVRDLRKSVKIDLQANKCISRACELAQMTQVCQGTCPVNFSEIHWSWKMAIDDVRFHSLRISVLPCSLLITKYTDQ